MRFIKPRRSIHKVYLHCSASDNPKHDNVATMDRWHKQRGWSGVGYHFFIRKNGTIERGRDINKTPAAQGGHNRGTIAICLHGLAKSKFTKAQFDALTNLCGQIGAAYPHSTFHGHCEVSAKTCPVFDYRKVLNLSGNGHLNIQDTVEIKDDDSDFQVEVPHTNSLILRKGSKGLPVELLQRRLVELGYHVGDKYGHFGRLTRAAVLAFQADNHLVTDGIVGPASYEALADAESRTVSPQRSTANVMSIAAGGSRIADASIKGGMAGLGVSSVGILGVVGQFSDGFATLKEQIEPIAQPFGGLTEIMLVGLLCVVGFMTWQFFRTGNARTEDHRTGKTL